MSMFPSGFLIEKSSGEKFIPIGKAGARAHWEAPVGSLQNY